MDSDFLLGGPRRRRRRAADPTAQTTNASSAIAPASAGFSCASAVAAPRLSSPSSKTPAPPAAVPAPSQPARPHPSSCAGPAARPPVGDRLLPGRAVDGTGDDADDSDATLPPPENLAAASVPSPAAARSAAGPEAPDQAAGDGKTEHGEIVPPSWVSEAESDADTLPPPEADCGGAASVPVPEHGLGGVGVDTGAAAPGGLGAKKRPVRSEVAEDSASDGESPRKGRKRNVDSISRLGKRTRFDTGSRASDVVDSRGGALVAAKSMKLEVDECVPAGRRRLPSPCRGADDVAADIVQINYGGLVERERQMAREEEEREKEWGVELYPRIERGAAFSDSTDAEARETCLSSLPESQRCIWPVGFLPARINRFLKPYQRDGVMFLYRLFERGRGGLIADAMGLGKTVQMIAALGAMTGIWGRESKESCRILVCTPAAVQVNWKREIETWAPFRVRIFSSKSAVSVREDIKTDRCDVVLVSDNALRLDLCGDDCERRLAKIRWNYLVVDEVHVAKNRRSQIHEALLQLNVPLKYGMSGTIIQNKLEDLHYVMEMLVGPGKGWPDKKLFDKLYGKPIKTGSTKDATPFQKKEALLARKSLRERVLQKHLIRRPKAILEGDIPPKTDSLVSLVLPRHTLQGRMWVKFINSYDAYMVRKAKDPCSCGSKMESRSCCHGYPTKQEELENSPLWRQRHLDGAPCKHCPFCLGFRLVHVGQQITCHALLLYPLEDDEKGEAKAVKAEGSALKRQERLELMEYYTSGEVSAFSRVLALEKEAGMSSKLSVALRLLYKFRTEGHKTIVFYSNLRLGGILIRWAEDNAIGFKNIDGSVAKEERQKIIDEFQKEPVGLLPLFFVSKRAGGTGLNITAADRVLIFEPDWNPTLDLQAQDRAHRIGQRNTVKVYRMAVKDSIEEYKTRTAIRKNQMSNSVMDNVDEESLVNTWETGNMKAMLRIGESFHENDEASMGGHDSRSGEDMEFAPAFTVEEIDVTPSARQNRGKGGEEMCVFAEHDVLFDADVDVDDIQFDSKDDGSDDGVAFREGAATESGGNGTGFLNISETQDVDKIVYENNPSNRRCIYTSNEEKHRGRSHLVGMATKKNGGVNGRVGRVNDLDLDLHESDLQQPLDASDGDIATHEANKLPLPLPNGTLGRDARDSSTRMPKGGDKATQIRREEETVTDEKKPEDVKEARRESRPVRREQARKFRVSSVNEGGRKKRVSDMQLLDDDIESASDGDHYDAQAASRLHSKDIQPAAANTLQPPTVPNRNHKPSKSATAKVGKPASSKKKAGGTVFGRRRK